MSLRLRLPTRATMLRLIVFLCFLSLPSAKVLIGNLSSRKNGVKGKVFALNTRTIRVEQLFYDGKGDEVLFQVNNVTDPGANRGRVPLFKETCKAAENLPKYTGEDLELELPPDYTIDDIRYFSIYDRMAKSEFGGIEVNSTALKHVVVLKEATCTIRIQIQIAKVFPVPSDWNCEPLNGNFQIRWRVVANNTMVNFEQVARLENGDQWMAFGISGSNAKTWMVDADAAVAYRRDTKFYALDYHLESRNPCEIRTGAGVCPDTVRDRSKGFDDVRDVEGDFKNEITRVAYTRPVEGTDELLDKDIELEGPSFVVWAYGPLKVENLFPLFHLDPTTYPQKDTDVVIEFGREPINKCFPKPPTPSEVPDGNDAGFERPVLFNVTEITARIGPSGGVRGVSAITNSTALNIAWYLSANLSDETRDILIPVLGVQVGKTYTFKIFGGIPSYDEDFFVHPFYITSSDKGGYQGLTPKQRAEETVYAGITDIKKDKQGGVTSFKLPSGATGDICEITTSVEDTSGFVTYEDFHENLDTSCAENPTVTANAGKLVWTVTKETPDIVYYQSVNNVNMGFKIRVFSGEIDADAVAELRKLSGGGSRGANEPTVDESCVTDFKDKNIRFGACKRGLAGIIDIFWNINTTKGEIETLFRVEKKANVGYAGLGWGFSKMLGSNAAIVFELPNGDAQIGDYFLRDRDSRGVRPDNRQQLISPEADNSGDFIRGRFTRRLEVDGLPTISAESTDLIWAVGPRPGSPRSLTTHRRRGSGRLDLSESRPVFEEGETLEAIFIVHAVLMGISWLILVPIAITAIRFFKKFNPVTFNVHRGINFLAAILTIAGFIMAIISGGRTETAHLAIGCVVFSLVIVQVLLGALRPGREKAVRKTWFWIHAILGSLLSGLGIANCFLGIRTAKIGGPLGWYIAAGVVVGLMVLLQVVFAVMPNTFPRVDEEEGKKKIREERMKSGGRTFVRDD